MIFIAVLGIFARFTPGITPRGDLEALGAVEFLCGGAV
jgi:hypothetical protein